MIFNCLQCQNMGTEEREERPLTINEISKNPISNHSISMPMNFHMQQVI